METFGLLGVSAAAGELEFFHIEMLVRTSTGGDNVHASSISWRVV